MQLDWKVALSGKRDPDLYRVYADYLEEQGDITSQGWRWLASTDKFPHQTCLLKLSCFTWYNDSRDPFGLEDRLFRELEGWGFETRLSRWKDYETVFDALDALARAVVKLGEVAP